MKNKNILAAAVIVLAGVAARIIGMEMHWYNFAPIAAIGLFSGSVIKDRRLAIVMAIGAQLITDVYFAMFTNVPGFYGLSQTFTYGGLLAATFLGSMMKNRKALNIAGFSIAASLLFFALSNLGYFLQGWNGYSAVGFVKTYVDAVPFLKNALIGDMAGSILMFGTYALLSKKAEHKNWQAA